MPHIHKRTHTYRRLNTHTGSQPGIQTQSDALRHGQERDNSKAAASGVQHTDEFATCDGAHCQRGFVLRFDLEVGSILCLSDCTQYRF